MAIAESCTGGAIAARLTAMADASKYLLGSIVAYSNEWKEQFLGVKPETLKTKSAVSLEVVMEMARDSGVTQADFVIAVTGFAGP